jgi:hypothetical protein
VRRLSRLTAFLIRIVVLTASLFSSAFAFGYDTAWTFIYDGPKYADGSSINDILYDVKCLPNGVSVCVGASADTINSLQTLLIKIDPNGKLLQKKLFVTNNPVDVQYNLEYAQSLFIAKNDDFIIGGQRGFAPWVMRIDSTGNIRWTNWYYDSTKGPDKGYKL